MRRDAHLSDELLDGLTRKVDARERVFDGGLPAVGIRTSVVRALIAAARENAELRRERDEARADVVRMVEKVNRYHQEREHYRKERDEARAQLRIAQDLVKAAWETGTWVHDDECPGDDTCECEMVRAVNAAMMGWR